MTKTKTFHTHPALGFLTGLYDEIYNQIQDDPALECLRVRNLLDDLVDLDADILIWTLNNEGIDLPETIKDRYLDVIDTSKRLGMLPTGLALRFAAALLRKNA
jgi:hypothetical protein